MPVPVPTGVDRKVVNDGVSEGGPITGNNN